MIKVQADVENGIYLVEEFTCSDDQIVSNKVFNKHMFEPHLGVTMGTDRDWETPQLNICRFLRLPAL